MKVKLFFLLTMVMITLTTSQTVDVGPESRITGVEIILPELPTFNNNTAFVNASNFWITNSLGSLGDANPSQFDNVGGTLTIDTSYLGSLYLAIDGSNNMEAPLDMNVNNIININQLIAPDGSQIRFGTNSIFSGFDQSIVIQSNQTLGDGIITHGLTDNQGGKVIEAWQSGKNNSAGFHRNSYLIFSDLGLTNASLLINAPYMWDLLGISPAFNYDTSTEGAALGVQYGVETQKVILHDDLNEGELEGEGVFTWKVRDETNFNILGPLHLSQSRIEEIGISTGEQVTRLFANFEADILFPMVLITSGKGADEWTAESSINCPPNGDFCSHAGPAGGSADTIMQSNFTTIDTDNLNLSFMLNTIDMGFGGDLEVIIDDNEGNSATLYSLIGSDISDSLISVIPSTTYEEKTLVTIEFIFSSSHPNRGDVFIDSINLSGIATASTVQNITLTDSEIKLGLGESRGDGSGRSVYDIFWNASSLTLELPGNTTFIDVTEATLNVTGNASIGDTLHVDYINSLNNQDVTFNNLSVLDGFTVGSTPSFLGTRKIKVFDDGIQFNARLTFIATGNTGFPSLEFITDGNNNKRTLIRHDVGSTSNNFDLNFFTTNNLDVRSAVKITGPGDLEFQNDNQGLVWGANRDYKMREFNGDLQLRYLGATGDFLVDDMDLIVENTVEANNFIANSLSGSYTGGSANVCVYNNGSFFASESACP